MTNYHEKETRPWIEQALSDVKAELETESNEGKINSLIKNCHFIKEYYPRVDFDEALPLKDFGLSKDFELSLEQEIVRLRESEVQIIKGNKTIELIEGWSGDSQDVLSWPIYNLKLTLRSMENTVKVFYDCADKLSGVSKLYIKHIYLFEHLRMLTRGPAMFDVRGLKRFLEEKQTGKQIYQANFSDWMMAAYMTHYYFHSLRRSISDYSPHKGILKEFKAKAKYEELNFYVSIIETYLKRSKDVISEELSTKSLTKLELIRIELFEISIHNDDIEKMIDDLNKCYYEAKEELRTFKTLEAQIMVSIRKYGLEQQIANKSKTEKNLPDTPKMSPEMRVLCVFLDKPDLSITKIAEAAGVHRTSLYRMDKFKQVRKMHKAQEEESYRNAKPAGEKDGETGKIEAWQE